MPEHEESNLAEIKKLKFLDIKDVKDMKQSFEVKLQENNLLLRLKMKEKEFIFT
jgi:hypothetical protein